MRVKRFVAFSMEEAVAKIKFEMGPDAVILHTRYFKEGGFLGLFGRKYVEVTAATDYQEHGLGPKLRGDSQKGPTPVFSADKNAQALNHPLPVNIAHELHEMKEMVQQVAQLLKVSKKTTCSPNGQPYQILLRNQDVEENLVQRIIQDSLKQVDLLPEPSEEQRSQLFIHNLLSLMQKGKPLVLENKRINRPFVYALVGPTGVGKTTTIAKLAASYAILEQKKVAFVTVDTYRIAAVDQLKAIGDIMNVNVNVVYSPQELQECLANLAGYELVFIDTAGRSHKNALQISELKSYLDIANPDDVLLVLSAATKFQDLRDIIAAYRTLNITRLIFTKLDETSYYGPLYSIACLEKTPLAYVTTGQNIPDDIEAADPLKIVGLLTKEKNNE